MEQMFNDCFRCEYDFGNIFAPISLIMYPNYFLKGIASTFVQVLELIGRPVNTHICFTTTLVRCDGSASHSICVISSDSLPFELLALCVNKARIELSSSATMVFKRIFLLLALYKFM